jgi:hypothetical protein
MQKLSIRKLDEGTYEVGPRHNGPSVVVPAKNKSDALKQAKAKLYQRPHLQQELAQAQVTHDFNRTEEAIKYRKEVIHG